MNRIDRVRSPHRYPRPMPWLPRAIAALLLACAGSAHAVSIASVEIRGLDEEME